jgi:hypothetical protein
MMSRVMGKGKCRAPTSPRVVTVTSNCPEICYANTVCCTISDFSSSWIFASQTGRREYSQSDLGILFSLFATVTSSCHSSPDLSSLCSLEERYEQDPMNTLRMTLVFYFLFTTELCLLITLQLVQRRKQIETSHPARVSLLCVLNRLFRLLICSFQLETVFNPSEQPSSGIRGKRKSLFAVLNGGVEVTTNCRRNEDDCAWGKLYHKFHVPQHQMAALSIVEVTEGTNCAPTKGKVLGVAVR